MFEKLFLSDSDIENGGFRDLLGSEKGNARPYTKSRKKSEEKRCKNRKKKPYLGACACSETEKPVSFSVVFGMQS